MAWWLWMGIGLLFLLLEMLTPGIFVAFFIGVAALLVGLGRVLGLLEPLWLQGLLFSVLSVVSLLALRQPLRDLVAARRGGPHAEVDSLVGELATPPEDIEPGATGQAELRGTTWTARNADTRRLKRGERCRVERVDGLLLWIRAE